MAVHMVRRHRILEMFLATELGYAWDEIHDEAEVLEHAVTDRFIDRVDAKLGHPSEDPHGDAIPSRDGVVTPAPAVPLVDVTHPEPVRVTRVSDESPETLRVLAEAGIQPGAVLRVLPGPARSATVQVRVAGGGTTPEGGLLGDGSPADRQTQTSPGTQGADVTWGDALELGILMAEAVWVQALTHAG